MNEEQDIIIAGFGGQGVLLAGEVLANALMIEGRNVTWFPSYGAEMRGGTVNCEIVTSDDEVSAVNKKQADIIIALNQLSFDKFLNKLKEGGMIIANTSLVVEKRLRNDIKYIFAPITKMANDLSENKIANIIALGILAKKSGLVKLESLKKALENVIPEHRKNLLPLNSQALVVGFGL